MNGVIVFHDGFDSAISCHSEPLPQVSTDLWLALSSRSPVGQAATALYKLDDVVDDDNSRTEHQRQKLLTWYRKVLLPCLEPNGEIHAIGTRYHPMDLYGHFLKEADLYRLDLETRKLVLQKKEEEAA